MDLPAPWISLGAALAGAGLWALMSFRRALPRHSHGAAAVFLLAAALALGDLRFSDADQAWHTVVVVDQTPSAVPIADLASWRQDWRRVADTWPPGSTLRVGVLDGRATLPDFGDGLATAQARFRPRIESRLGLGVSHALALLADHSGARRIVLVSDGAETAGADLDSAWESLPALIPRLKAASVPVDVVALAVARPDLRITRFSGPPTFRAPDTLTLELELTSTALVEVRVELTRTAAAGARTSIALDPARFTLAPHQPLRLSLVNRVEEEAAALGYEALVHAVDADFEPAALTFNNSRRLVVPSEREIAPAVLISQTPDGEFARWLRRSLESAPESPPLRVFGPEEAERSPGEVRSAALIVLEDISHEALGVPLEEEARSGLAHLVRDAVRLGGAGLVTLGGEHAFGPGGFANTKFEEALLPLRCDPGDQRLDVVIAVDASASMARRQSPQDPAKDQRVRKALVRLSRSLGDDDRAAFLRFNTRALDDPRFESRAQALSRLRDWEKELPAGGTDLIAAFQAAARAIGRSSAPFRHVLVLTDGAHGGDPGAANARLGAEVRAWEREDIGLTVFQAGAGNLDWSAILGVHGRLIDLDYASVAEDLVAEWRRRKDFVREPTPPMRPGALPAGWTPGPDTIAAPAKIVAAKADDDAVVLYESAEGLPLLVAARRGMGWSLALLTHPGRADFAAALDQDQRFQDALAGWIVSARAPARAPLSLTQDHGASWILETERELPVGATLTFDDHVSLPVRRAGFHRYLVAGAPGRDALAGGALFTRPGALVADGRVVALVYEQEPEHPESRALDARPSVLRDLALATNGKAWNGLPRPEEFTRHWRSQSSGDRAPGTPLLPYLATTALSALIALLISVAVQPGGGHPSSLDTRRRGRGAWRFSQDEP